MPKIYLELEKETSGEFNPYEARSSPHILLRTLNSERILPPESGTLTKCNHLLLGPGIIFH